MACSSLAVCLPAPLKCASSSPPPLLSSQQVLFKHLQEMLEPSTLLLAEANAAGCCRAGPASSPSLHHGMWLLAHSRPAPCTPNSRLPQTGDSIFNCQKLRLPDGCQ